MLIALVLLPRGDRAHPLDRHAELKRARANDDRVLRGRVDVTACATVP
jgi:hypothetical protein